jgi:hypothetical protein
MEFYMKQQKFFVPTNDFVFKMIFGDERGASVRSSFAPQPAAATQTT